MIRLEKVNKVYDGGFHALKDINLTFEKGKINVLIGPSGCGKTTTMKLLNRLTDFTDGSITINGRNIRDFSPVELRRQMGYVIQNIGLFPHMNIYDNVAAVPKLLKWDRKRIHKRVIELLEMVNLDPKTYSRRYPSELSGGQQQRIGVIRALAAEPDTILMDEPFSALDPISREQLQDELVRLQEDIQKTIVFVTHDMDEAIKIADQIILMKDGRVVQQGSPEELMTNPADEFVEEFIGSKRLNNGFSIPTVEKLMTKSVPSITTEATVSSAIDIMMDHQLKALPVVNENDQYAGMISLFTALHRIDQPLGEVIQSTTTLFPKMDGKKAFAAFTDSDISLLPVLSKSKQLVGVLDKDHLAKEVYTLLEQKCGDI